MPVYRSPVRTAITALIVAAWLTACGGGGGGGGGSGGGGGADMRGGSASGPGLDEVERLSRSDGTTPAGGDDAASGLESSASSDDAPGRPSGGTPPLPPDAPVDDTPVDAVQSDTPVGPAGAAPGSHGALTFREEWNAPRLDTDKWLTRMFHWTTQELDNWRIEDGVLKIWTPRGPDGRFEFNNRAMNTDGKFTQRYGWFEMEAKLPKGRGLWPSFWLYAHNDDTRPEIDIMEAHGGGDEWWATADGRPIDYGATVWVSPANGSSTGWIDHQRPGWLFPVGDLTAAFHKYGALWEPDGITFFFDGRPIGPKIMTNRLNQQMYLIIGLGTGAPGSFNAPTDATPTTIANAYEINYVRAWALPSGTRTGGTHPDPSR